MPWSQWLKLEQPSGHHGPALYEIRAVRDNSPLQVQRLLGPDPSGVLAIGETRAFEERRLQFRSGVRNGAGHSEANLIWVLRRTSAVRTLLRDSMLEYRFFAARTKAAAIALEKGRLWKYARKFGEVPPFNSSFPGRSEKIAEHRRAARQRRLLPTAGLR